MLPREGDNARANQRSSKDRRAGEGGCHAARVLVRVPGDEIGDEERQRNLEGDEQRERGEQDRDRLPDGQLARVGARRAQPPRAAPLRRRVRGAGHEGDRAGRPPRGPLALVPFFRLLDPADAGRRREDGRVAVVPADAQARRLVGDDLLDDAPPRRLRDALGLDHDPVSNVRSHCSTSSAATLALPSSSRKEVRAVATRDLTSALDEAGVSYELLPHAHTESALAEAQALGVSPGDVAKTLVVKTPGGYVRAVLPASARLDLRKLREIHGGGRHAVHLATEEDLRRD